MDLEKVMPQISYTISKNDFYTLNYELFKSDHYKNTINQLTKEKLQQLAVFAANIEEPYVLGEFNSEEHYLKTLRLVLASTHETRNRILFFLNEIMPQLPVKKSFLDVGPGDGLLTKELAPHFEHITAIDSNRHILNSLGEHLPDTVDFVKINTNIITAQWSSNYYDLSVLSHVLYYIDPIYWLDVVKKTFQGLKKDGLLVIVLGGDELDKAELIKNFGGQTLKTDQLALECQNTFGYANVSLCASDELFVACSRQCMLHIAGFMLGDANITASKDDLIGYINQKFQQSENHFKMTTRQKYIIIRKTVH